MIYNIMNRKQLTFKELPKFNSKQWFDLNDLPGEIWEDVFNAIGRYQVSNYGRLKRIYNS